MGLKNLIFRRRTSNHNPHTHPLHADDVITDWSTDPRMGITYVNPTINSAGRTRGSYTSKLSQDWIQTGRGWRKVTESESLTTHTPSFAIQTITSMLETTLFFTANILRRTIPALHTLRSNEASTFEQMIAIRDLTFAGLYGFTLGHIICVVCQVFLDVAGVTAWLKNPIALGGLGILFCSLREDRTDHGEAQFHESTGIGRQPPGIFESSDLFEGVN